MKYKWLKTILGTLGLLILQILVSWFIASRTAQPWTLGSFFRNPYILLFWGAYFIFSIVLSLWARIYRTKK